MLVMVITISITTPTPTYAAGASGAVSQGLGVATGLQDRFEVLWV
jgi:hypothetical protein